MTQEYSDITGMEISGSKSNSWGTTPALRTELKRERAFSLPVVEEERYLGAQLSYSRKRCRTTLTVKLDECRRMCERIQNLPLGMDLRAALVSCFVTPKGLYACAATAPSHKALRSLRAACTRAIWGQANPWRAPEMV